MSDYEICERCGKSYFHWTVREWRIELGEVHRKPHWCEECTKAVQQALIRAIDRQPA